MIQQIPTNCGYSLPAVSSAMQKAISRGDAKLAGYWALELWPAATANTCGGGSSRLARKIAGASSPPKRRLSTTATPRSTATCHPAPLRATTFEVLDRLPGRYVVFERDFTELYGDWREWGGMQVSNLGFTYGLSKPALFAPKHTQPADSHHQPYQAFLDLPGTCGNPDT
jgi:hypothetical protein